MLDMTLVQKVYQLCALNHNRVVDLQSSGNLDNKAVERKGISHAQNRSTIEFFVFCF